MDRIELDIWTAREVARLLALVENETRYYQEILSALPKPLAVVTRELAIVSTNRAFRELFSVRQEDLAQKTLDQLAPNPGLRDTIAAAIDRGESGGVVETEVPGGDRRGSPLHVTVAPLRDWYHRPTDEAVILLEEPRVASPGTRGPAGAVLWQHDPAGGARFFNRPELLGLTAEGWGQRMVSEDASRVAWVYEAALESGQAATVEYRVRRADGGTDWLADRVQPVADPSGRGVQLQVVTTDESERHRHLERSITSRRMEPLGRLAGRMAHDCNNLLMIIGGYGEELMGRLPEGDESRAGLAEILKASERVSMLTQQLLAFSRAPAAQAQWVDLHDFLRRGAFGAQLRLGNDAEGVLADVRRLEAALRSLSAFAAETLPKGANLVFQTSRETIISDYGEGLPKGRFVVLRIGPVHDATSEVIERWPEPFFARAGHSSGAGLAPAYVALDQMGASVTLVPEPGGIAWFTIRFAVSHGPEPARPPKATRAEPTPVKLETVLVVDDEESIRTLVARILTKQGYGVIQASSGPEALRLSENYTGEIDIAVSDVMLPELRGPELIQRIRRKRPQLRVLYISGYTDDPSLSSASLKSGEAFLAKPFTIAELLLGVRTVLDAPVT